MMFKGRSVFNASFDIYAENYHSVRPGYPAEMYDDIRRHCNLDAESRVLEIGAGSGIATVELAKFGSQIVALEPGANLVEIARRQTSTYPNVQVVKGTFEDFEDRTPYDTIMAFTAFHWLREGGRFQKISDLLKGSGSVVIVWNSFFQSETPVTQAINHVYAECLPEIYPDVVIASDVNRGVLDKLQGREVEIWQSRSVYPVFVRKYQTLYNYDATTYPELLNTFPKVVELPDEQRQRFLGRISEVIQQFGKITVPVLTTLIVCRKRDEYLKAISRT